MIGNNDSSDTIESLDVLIDGLESGHLLAIGLDVFPGDPPDPSHRIFEDLRCVCAPHSVGCSVLTMHRIFKLMATDMVAVLQG